MKIKPWENVYDATTEREGCLQFSLRKKKLLGSEDCLYNNIYTPKVIFNDISTLIFFSNFQTYIL